MPARCEGAFQTGYRRRLGCHADRHLHLGEAGRLAFSRAAWFTVARCRVPGQGDQ